MEVKRPSKFDIKTQEYDLLHFSIFLWITIDYTWHLVKLGSEDADVEPI